jgi:N-sulfoglucosamine sulfohydrolase
MRVRPGKNPLRQILLPCRCLPTTLIPLPYEKVFARLYDNIARLDSLVGVHLEALEKEGLAENTIVFFWSDHGDGLPRGKRWLYDSGLKVPMVIRWPGQIQAGSVNDRLVSSIDFGPTVLSMADVPVPYHMQGIPFMGKHEGPARDLAFSARDRFDESYDMVRSARDKHFRYVRNYYPNQAKIIWVPYRNRSPIMQELLRLHAADQLNPAQADWFENTREPEELFDCEADPHHLHNLAYDPKYRDILNKMRKRVDQWQSDTKDLGFYSEEQLVAQWYPKGERPTTAAVHFVPNTEGNRNAKIITEGELTYPATMTLYCATQGASIAYTFDAGDEPHWQLYTGPIRLPKGVSTLRAKAIRYGYHHSEEASLELLVK